MQPVNHAGTLSATPSPGNLPRLLYAPTPNKRLALRYDRLGFIVQALLQTARILLVAGRLARELWKPPLSDLSESGSPTLPVLSFRL